MSKRTHYKRPDNPRRIRLTKRDQRIFETIHAFDGMMSYTQLKRLFFPGKWDTGAQERLRRLYRNGYLDMADDANVHRVPRGETVYWLDKNGAEVVAGLQGLELKEFKWRKMGRWSLIAHDLAVNDFRLTIVDACAAHPDATLYDWVPESDFVLDPDTVTYTTITGRTESRQVRPDGFFLIRKPSQKRPGKQVEYAFLLEIDMGTESNVRFARDKVPQGNAYLKSDAYQRRFGVTYGRWLVVTTGQERMLRMMEQTGRSGGGALWLFTTFARLDTASVLADPIWHVPERSERVSLIDPTD